MLLYAAEDVNSGYSSQLYSPPCVPQRSTFISPRQGVQLRSSGNGSPANRGDLDLTVTTSTRTSVYVQHCGMIAA